MADRRGLTDSWRPSERIPPIPYTRPRYDPSVHDPDLEDRQAMDMRSPTRGQHRTHGSEPSSSRPRAFSTPRFPPKSHILAPLDQPEKHPVMPPESTPSKTALGKSFLTPVTSMSIITHLDNLLSTDHDYRSLQDQEQNLKKVLTKLKDEVDSAARRPHQVYTDSLRHKVATAEEDLHRVQSKLKASHARRTALLHDLSQNLSKKDDNETVISVQAKLSILERQLLEEKTTRSDERATLQEEVQTMEIALAELTSELDNQQAKLSDQGTEALQNFDKLHQKNTSLETLISRLNARVSNLFQDIVTMKNQLGNTTARNSKTTTISQLVADTAAKVETVSKGHRDITEHVAQNCKITMGGLNDLRRVINQLPSPLDFQKLVNAIQASSQSLAKVDHDMQQLDTSVKDQLATVVENNMSCHNSVTKLSAKVKAAKQAVEERLVSMEKELDRVNKAVEGLEAGPSHANDDIDDLQHGGDATPTLTEEADEDDLLNEPTQPGRESLTSSENTMEGAESSSSKRKRKSRAEASETVSMRPKSRKRRKSRHHPKHEEEPISISD